MLVCSADHARANRERRPATLAPPEPSLGAWQPGTTYAEIVKGHGSRSTSPVTHRMQYDIKVSRDTSPEIESEIISDVQISQTEIVEPSEPSVLSECVVSECETFPSDANVYYDSEIPYYTEQQIKSEESEIQVPSVFQSDDSMILTNLSSIERSERSVSPALKCRSQDLSYAEILALGLRKQVNTQTITTLPKPQVAQVEIIKEINVEVQKSTSVNDPKIITNDSLKPKSVKIERSSQRSRSRDMPRQRRAPEKRPTKAHDMQTLKKKKIAKKAIEVTDFEENFESIESEKSSAKVVPEIITNITDMTVNDELYKKYQHEHNSEICENIIDIDNSNSDIIELEQRKSKKKYKTKKSKTPEDEIEKALKEIEESDKHKKKKVKDSTEKNKDILTENLHCKSAIEHSDVKVEAKDSDTVSKNKKKKTHKKSQEKLDKLSEILQPDVITKMKPSSIHDAEISNESLIQNVEQQKIDVLCKNDSTVLTISTEETQPEPCTKEKASDEILTKINPSATENETGKAQVIEQLQVTEHLSSSQIVLDNVISYTEDRIVPKSELVSIKPKKKKKNKKHENVSCEDKNKSDKILKGDDCLIDDVANQEQHTSGLKLETADKHFAVTRDIEKTTDTITCAKEKVNESRKKIKSKKVSTKDSQLIDTEKYSKTNKETETITGKLSLDNSSNSSLQKAEASENLEIEDEERSIVLQEIKTENKTNIVIQESTSDTKSVVVNTNIIAMDWNALMEEENITFEPLTVTEGEPSASDSSEQRASEVLIIQGSIEKPKTEENNQIRVDINSEKEQNISDLMTVQSVSSTINEQNNNDKFFLTETQKERSMNVVDEITHYNIIDQDQDTRKIYLITHEEKKLPPIRTVKVFTSKSNSLEETPEGSSKPDETIDEEQTISDSKDDYHLEENIKTAHRKKDLEVLRSNEETIEVFGVETEIKNILQNDTQVSKSHIMIVNKDKENTSCNFEELSELSSHSLEDTLLKESEESVSDDDILEQAIFGSVQKRKKQTIKSKYVPYQELSEEIKSYATGVNFEQLDYDYYNYISNQRLIEEEKRATQSSTEDKKLHDCCQIVKKTTDLEQDVESRAQNSNFSKIISNTILPKFSPNGEQIVNPILTEPEIPIKVWSIVENDSMISCYQELQDSERRYGIAVTSKYMDDSAESLNANNVNVCTEEANDKINQDNLKQYTDENIVIKEHISASKFKEISEQTEKERESLYDQINYNYQNIADAEIILGTVNTKKMSITKNTGQVILLDDSQKDFKDYVNQKDHDDFASDLLTTKCRNPLSATEKSDDTIKSTLKNDVNVMAYIPEIPQHNYQAITDAERLLAFTKEQIISKEKQLSQNYEDISLAENLVGVVNTREVIQQSTQEHIETIVKNIENNVPLENKHQPNLQKDNEEANASSKVINNSDTQKQMSEKNKNIDVNNQNSDEKSIKNYLYMETPRQNYQDLVDAEKILAINKAYKMYVKPELYNINDKTNLVDTTESTVHKTNCEINAILYHEINDAEKIFALMRKPTDQTTSILLKDIHKLTDCESPSIMNVNVIPLDEEKNDESQPITSKSENTNVDEISDATVSSEISQNIVDVTKENLQDSMLSREKNIDIQYKEELSVSDGEKTDDAILAVTIKEKMMPENCQIEYTIDLINQEKALETTGENIDTISEIAESSKLPLSASEIASNEIPSVFDKISKLEITDKRESIVPIVYEMESLDKISELSQVKCTDNETNLKITEDEHDEYVIVEIIKSDTKQVSCPESPFSDCNDIRNENTSNNQHDSSVNLVEDGAKVINDKIVNLICSPKMSENEEKCVVTEVISQDTIENEVEITEIEEGFEIITDTHSIQRDVKLMEKSLINVEKSNEPGSISATFIDMEKNNLVSTVTEPVDTQKPLVDHKSQDSILTNITSESDNETQTKNINTADNENDTVDTRNKLTRPEKSPIHSLHDLLPEIDSIPEFKPSYSSSILYSNLSADAPEFTPSYMYHPVVCDNKISSNVDTDVEKNKSKLEENIREIESKTLKQNVPKMISYSSVLAKQQTEQTNLQSCVPQNKELQESIVISPQNVQEKLVESKSKRNKKKKKEHDKKEITICSKSSSKDQDLPLSSHITTEPVNVWAKAAEEGKSYAEVLAEGLVALEQKDTDIVELVISKTDEIDAMKIAVEDILTLKEPSISYEKYDETSSSWAKIVASNRPSPERVDKSSLKIQNESQSPIQKAPVILVDESDADIPKLDTHVDAEGFITVDRNRRSRSRSRDTRSASVSKMAQNSDQTRDKSENRFDALTYTLKPDKDLESIPSSLSEEEKDSVKKGRKSRPSKSKEKEIPLQSIAIGASTSDEDKPPIKKDKKKRSSKSKDKTIKSAEQMTTHIVHEPFSKEKENYETELGDIHKKKKKNTKDKKSDIESKNATDTSTVEITSSEYENVELVGELSKDINKTPLSTPESLHTPIKDRFYSEAQYWKVDPSELDVLDSVNDVITVQILETNTEEIKNKIKHEEIEGPNSKSECNITITQEENIIFKSPIDKIYDDQSLENKIADIQREIEELLLPENDNSTASDEISFKLKETNVMVEELQDEIFHNMTPLVAAPEFDELTSHQSSSTYQSKEDEHDARASKNQTQAVSENSKLQNKVIQGNFDSKQQNISTDESFNIRDEKITQEENVQKFEKEIQNASHISINSSVPLTTNIISKDITNNLSDLKSDDFWCNKFITDDAEKLLAHENSNDTTVQLEKKAISLVTNNKLESNLKCDQSFWPEKHLYHDAECQYFMSLANKTKASLNSQTKILSKDQHDKDRDPDGRSGNSSDVEEKDPRQSNGSTFDSNYISMDLPGGICSWKDHSSYLSLETPSDSLTGPISEETPQLEVDIPEDKLTTLSLEPVSVPTPKQEEHAEERTLKAAKDDLSNDIETLLEEVKIVQANLSDLPDESLDAMEAGLREGISILVKCEEAASLLEQKIMDFRQESEVQVLLKELVMIKARISKLLNQARQGLTTIQDAKTELARQNREIEEQMEKVAILDNWLGDINLELKQSTEQTEILTEDEIIKYIEIYERYIREYEEYEILIQSIIVIIRDDSSQLKEKLNVTRRTLDETRNLVIVEIERLRQLLIHMRTAPEVIEDDISQTDRTIDSTSMPEEIVSPRERTKEQSINESTLKKVDREENSKIITKPDNEIQDKQLNIQETAHAVPRTTIETQTGKSLMSDAPELVDKSVICQPEEKITHEISITCAPPQDVEIQTSELKSEKEFLENIQVKQTVSDGHETIEIASRPVVRDQKTDQTLYIDAYYKDDDIHKDSKLNIIHSLPQSFETIMVEPDETTTEVVVDADGTKRIIVKKIRKTLVTRQQVLTSEPKTHILSTQDIPTDQSCSQLVLKKDEFSTSTKNEGGYIKYVDSQNYDGQVLTAIPGGEVEIQELTTHPDMTITIENELKPEEIFQIAEGEIQPHIQTSSSSVTAIVQQVTKRIVRTKRRIIRRVVVIDGKEHVTEEVIEEPETIEISEEQIPRVSINVIEGKTIVEDSDDKPDNPPDTENHDRPQDERHDGEGNDPNIKNANNEKIHIEEPNTKFLQEEKEQRQSSHAENDLIQNMSREFIQKENELTNTINNANNTKVTYSTTEGSLELKTEPQFSNEDDNLITTTSDISSHKASVSTVVQHVTTKVTRMKKRIIKHIQIIDGKENITEEIIEEPDDVLFIENEPNVNIQEEINCMKIIDEDNKKEGKEYITEEIVENLEGYRYKPDIVEGTSSESLDKQRIVERNEREIYKSPLKTDITDIAEPMSIINSPHSLTDTLRDIPLKPENIEQNIEEYYQPQIQTVLTTTRKHIIRHVDIIDGKEHVTEEVVEDPENIQVFKGVPEGYTIQEENSNNYVDRTHEQTLITRTRKRIIKHIQIIDGKEHITEEVFEEPDDINIVETPQLYVNIEDTIKSKPLEHTMEFESNVINKDNELSFEIKSKELNNQTLSDVSHLLIQSEIDHSTSLKHTDKDHLKDVESQDPQEFVVKELNEQIFSTVPENIATVTKITKTNRRIIRYINTVNGKEQVIEEVIDEPDDVEVVESEPDVSHILQKEGDITKRVKIIKQVQIIDGKEYITENIIEDSEHEYVPDSTVTTTINVNMLKSDSVDAIKHDDKKVYPSTSSTQLEKFNKYTDNNDKIKTEIFIKEENKKVGNENTDQNFVRKETFTEKNKYPHEPKGTKHISINENEDSRNILEETDISPGENTKMIDMTNKEIHDQQEQLASKSSEELPKPEVKQHKGEDNKFSDIFHVKTSDVTKAVPTDAIDNDVNIEQKLTSFVHEPESELDRDKPVQNIETHKNTKQVGTEELIDENTLKTNIAKQVDSQSSNVKTRISPEVEKSNETLPEIPIISLVKQSMEAQSYDVLPSTLKNITEQFLCRESFVDNGQIIDSKSSAFMSKEIRSVETSPISLELDAKQSSLDVQVPPIKLDDKEILSTTDDLVPVLKPEIKEPLPVETTEDNKQQTLISQSSEVEDIPPTPFRLPGELLETKIMKSDDNVIVDEKDLNATELSESPKGTEEFSVPSKPSETRNVKSEVNINVEEKVLNASRLSESPKVNVNYLQKDLPLSQITLDTGNMPQSDIPINKSKHEVTTFIESEQMDTHLRQMADSLNISDQRKSEKNDQSIENPSKLSKSQDKNADMHEPSQTIDIKMSLKKSDANMKREPKLEADIQIQEFEMSKPLLVKKDIRGQLPVDVNISEQHIIKKYQDDASEIRPASEELIPDAKNKIIFEDSEVEPLGSHISLISLETEYIAETDKSIGGTDSSSLAHYVELQTPTFIESPKPTELILEEVLNLEDKYEPISLSTEAEQTEEKGYEPEDISLGKELVSEKKKKHKKRKSHAISEETLYPIQTATDTTISTPVEMDESIQQRKIKSRKGRKKIQAIGKSSEEEPETKPETPKVGSEIVTTSPQDESYHTLSEQSDVNTVKIVEECVGSSPEIIEKEVSTTVTYPVPIVEEIATTEYSVQTSPEIQESATKDKTSKKETIDCELQTSPTPVNEVLVQTTPIDDKEAHTQTIEDIKICERVDVLDSEIQTSRTETPELIVTTEVTTQVFPRDIEVSDDKFSQTSSPEMEEHKEIVEKSSRDIQTSPIPKIQKEEKSTEIVTETMESVMQTVKQEVKDQETLTTPIETMDVQDCSIQTPEISLVTTYTQFELPTKELGLDLRSSSHLPELNLTAKAETKDCTQQTSPRDSNDEKPDFTIAKGEVIMMDNVQQTSPRIDSHIGSPILDYAKTEIVSVDSTQQTSPRDIILAEIESAKTNIITIDSTQQTSPRDYTEDSISTSTDEPYEVHLRAQISIPQTTNDFIQNERQGEQMAESLPSDSYKQRKKKTKRKTESPLHSPSSLSDPINAELSLSVTPTSDDLSSKDTSSIDEGISQLASPVYSRKQNQERHVSTSRPTYSDVVQRSKSKSPSPCKTVFVPKDEKTRLINAMEKRTQSLSEPQRISENALTVALIEPTVEKAYDLVVNKELDEVKNAAKNNDTSKIEKSIIIVIETISIWLEEIQYKIQRQTVADEPLSDEKERVKLLENYVQNLKQIVYVTEVNEEIILLIETLTRQVTAVSNLNTQTSALVKENEKEWNKFLSDINILSQSLDAVKAEIDILILSETPTQQKLDNLDKFEIENVNNTDSAKKLFQLYRSFIEINPKKECPSKLYACNDDIKQIENTINTERERLLQLSSLAEEYEQTLQDFGQITDVAEALLDGKIIVSNLDHLHEEIQKHRKFFVNLSHCRAILESLEDNLDNETRTKYASLHHSLHDRATIIIDRAASRAQQMTLAASRWSVLDHNMKEEKQWLRVAEQRIPDLSNVTSMDNEQYINLYQSISLDASQHHAKILRLISISEGLQGLIVCSGLESECSMVLDTLLKLQEEVDSRLTRLTAFRENWLTYDHLIDRIEGWMKLANKELEHITPENITTTSNLRRFWELKAQHEVHNNLKNESGVQFEKALEILPISDEMVQRQFFSKIEDKWGELSSRISNIHTTAIQNISDRDVPSSEKLNILEDEMRELRSMLDSLKGVIKSEDELNLYIERLQVMTSRIDRIQNELGRLSLLPTAESERLGALLTQSGILDDQIAEELERSLLLKEKIVQVQSGIARCQKNQRRARLTLEECEAAERLGSDVVEGASQTCEKLIEDLSAQWRDILALRQALHTLPTALRVCVSPIGVERDISGLQDTHCELEAACNELSVRLRSKLQLWRRFERQLELVQGAVREADYMVELLTVQGQVDYDRLLKATEKLETLSESLSRRSGELVGSLREAAVPLQATTEATVAAQLRKELDDAAAAYEHTCANLTQLCDKYHKAVDLWRRYREAAACVRAFAEHHEGVVHSLRPNDAPAAHQACLEQEARVAELRSLAARVAAETGSRALQADADALARRLQLVSGAVQALADLGEARQLARAKAQHAKDMFCDMRQDLTPVQEDGEIVEDKLIALRDNLIALGKSEADIAPAKAELPDIDRDVSDEHSIVRILELWQAMFRDTFLHYHRLSTALVRSGDAATALRLWNEYLLDLQSFLSGTVPVDYENLTEHRRLCRVHRNLLTSQRSVLMNENRETKNRDLADKFDTLTNLHNETLARIVERHDEVCTRIAAWDEYRQIYTELLRWLKEIEREKEKLQLRYVHIKRINKILTNIQNLADKLPEGRKLSDKLLQNLKKILVFTEETYAASVRMEYAGIVKRVDNLQASLDTWRDFLTRILGLIGEYEKLTNDLQKLYTKTQGDVISYADEDRLSRPQIKKAIDKYNDLRNKIDKTETQIEALSVIQEQLKECLSPQDIRIVSQKVWQLRQQRADLEHQLSIIIHRLQERLEIYTLFDSRLSRFSEWITTLESRLDIATSPSELVALDPQDLVRRITSDIQAETALKEREFEWLVETGSTLVDLSKKDEKSYSKNTSKQLKDIQERWHKLQETGRNRIAKINELLETIAKLEERLTEIRMKLHTIESSLTTTVVIEYLTTKSIDAKFTERDEIHKNIENESGEVGKTLNLCDLVFNDPDVLKGNFDLRNLRTGADIVEKKWKNICDMSEQRKKALKEIRKSAELVNSLLPKVEKKLDAIEKRVEKIETRKQRGEAEDESISKNAIKDLDGLESDIKKLEDAYSRIVSARGVEVRGSAADDASRIRSSVRKWQQLRGRLDAAGADAHKQFVSAHGKAVVTLAEADVRLTRALHLAPTPTDKIATLKELDGVEEDLRECAALVDDADRLSVSVVSIPGVSDMVGEYRALFADVRTRLDIAKAEVVGDVDSAVQVDTLKWETDAALQVDTLTSKETYRNELATAVKETSDSLEALRTALLQEIKEDAKSDELATAAKEIAKAGAKPEQTLELAKHLSELLLTECDATEDEAMLKEVESLSLRYEDLLTQAKKRELQINNLRLPHSASYALTCEHESGRLTCPLCSDRNWKQLDNDLWRLEQWLQFAEATDEARIDPPEQYDALEDTIQDHREFLLDLDSHKALVVSLNVVGAHVSRHARSAADARRLRDRLAGANARWDAACARAAAWQARLQAALVNNREFHDIVVELVQQLAAAERSVRAREPLRLTRPAPELRKDFRRFSELRDELSRAEPRVLALRDAAQLLTDDAQDVCRRLGELRLRLQSLRKLSGVYALKLGAALARSPQHGAALAAAAATATAVSAAQLMEEEPPALPPLDESLSEEHEEQQLSSVQRGLRFVSRVARASLPFQALLLLLLGAAALAPLSPGDCRGPPSLQPVLRYPHGPPPL